MTTPQETMQAYRAVIDQAYAALGIDQASPDARDPLRLADAVAKRVALHESERETSVALRSALIMFMSFCERMADLLPMGYHHCADQSCLHELCANCNPLAVVKRRIDYMAKVMEEASKAAELWANGSRILAALPTQVKLLHDDQAAAREMANEAAEAANVAQRELTTMTQARDEKQRELWKVKAVLSDALHEQELLTPPERWKKWVHDARAIFAADEAETTGGR